MASKSNIEWTDATWNPIVGCSIVSPGCTNCYAMKVAARVEACFKGTTGAPHYRGLTQASKAGPVWTGKVQIAPDEKLTEPLRWRKPRKIFVNSEGDLFHESIPDEWIWKVFQIMATAYEHTFQLLTKRSDRMRNWMTNCPKGWPHFGVGSEWPLPNVWLGVSTERQSEADERIPDLLATPAAVRFISAEPLLGPVDIGRWLDIRWQCSYCRRYYAGPYQNKCPDCDISFSWCGSHEFQSGSGLDWVIVGGESGHKARPMNPDWARSLRDQCSAAGVPFFFKQWGEWTEWPDDEFTSEEAESLELQNRYEHFQEHSGAMPAHMRRIGKKAAGRLLDGKEHSEFPYIKAETHAA